MAKVALDYTPPGIRGRPKMIWNQLKNVGINLANGMDNIKTCRIGMELERMVGIAANRIRWRKLISNILYRIWNFIVTINYCQDGVVSEGEMRWIKVHRLIQSFLFDIRKASWDENNSGCELDLNKCICGSNARDRSETSPDRPSFAEIPEYFECLTGCKAILLHN